MNLKYNTLASLTWEKLAENFNPKQQSTTTLGTDKGDGKRSRTDLKMSSLRNPNQKYKNMTEEGGMNWRILTWSKKTRLS